VRDGSGEQTPESGDPSLGWSQGGGLTEPSQAGHRKPPESTTCAAVVTSLESTDSVMAGLFGRDSTYMVLWVLQLIGAALVTPFVTRLVSPTQFGVISSANALMQVLFAIASSGMVTAIQRRYAGVAGPEMAARLLALSFMVVAVVMAVAFVSSGLWIDALGLAPERPTVLLATLWAGVSAVTSSLLAYLRSQDRLGAFSAVSLIQSVVAEVVSLALVACVANTATAFVAGQLAAQVVAAAASLVFVRPRLLRKSDRALVTSTLAFAVPLLPATLGAFVLNAADRLMLQGIVDAEAVARYQVAYNIGSLPMLVLGALHSAWLPRFFQVADEKKREAALADSSAALFRLLPPVMLGLACGSPILLRLWAPGAFHPDGLGLVTALIVVTAVAYTGQLAASRALLARGRSRVIATATVAAASLNIALNVVLIPWDGVMGAALATFISYGLLWVGLLIPTRRQRIRSNVTQIAVCSLAVVVTLLIATTPLTPPLLAGRVVAALLSLGWFLLVLRRVMSESSKPAKAGAPPPRAPRTRRR